MEAKKANTIQALVSLHRHGRGTLVVEAQPRNLPFVVIVLLMMVINKCSVGVDRATGRGPHTARPRYAKIVTRNRRLH